MPKFIVRQTIYLCKSIFVTCSAELYIFIGRNKGNNLLAKLGFRRNYSRLRIYMFGAKVLSIKNLSRRVLFPWLVRAAAAHLWRSSYWCARQSRGWRRRQAATPLYSTMTFPKRVHYSNCRSKSRRDTSATAFPLFAALRANQPLALVAYAELWTRVTLGVDLRSPSGVIDALATNWAHLRRDHWQKTARLILLKVGQST